MKALMYVGEKQMEVREIPKPEPKDGEALLQIISISGDEQVPATEAGEVVAMKNE